MVRAFRLGAADLRGGLGGGRDVLLTASRALASERRRLLYATEEDLYTDLFTGLQLRTERWAG